MRDADTGQDRAAKRTSSPDESRRLRKTLAHRNDAMQVPKAEVARATGVPRSTISNDLSGRRQISKYNVSKLARYFSVDPGVFLREV
jgi:plasmid maintenance system antidote protein VapI